MRKTPAANNDEVGARSRLDAPDRVIAKDAFDEGVHVVCVMDDRRRRRVPRATTRLSSPGTPLHLYGNV